MAKVCVFSGFYPLIKGGAEYQSSIIAEQLSKEHDVFFISIDHPKYEIIQHSRNIRVYCLSYKYTLNKISFYHPLFLKIKKILENEKPDLIYQRVLNSFSYHLSNYCMKNRIPFFIHIADEYCLTFETSLSSFVRKFMFRKIINTSAKFIVQTDTQEKLLLNHGVKPVLKVYNMHPFVDEFIKIKTETKYIIWIGSGRKVKQLELFLDISEGEFSDDIKFIVIGRLSDDEYGQSIRSRIENLSKVEYLGEKDNSFINNFIKQSYLLVNTSKSEGFSNTFIQAWQRGVPVVSLNSNPDGLIEKFNLGICCYGDTSNLSIALQGLIKDSSRYGKLSSNCLKVSDELFSIDSNYNKLRNIFQL